MRRNCLTAIVVWIALFAGYSFYLSRTDLPIEGALLGGLMMSFLVGFGLTMMNGARYANRDRALLAKFHRGERPHDGELAAVTGEIRATLDPLHAPFSGRECVVYRYDIGPVDRENARDYVGFAFARCAIHSPHGTYPLGVFPVLHGFPEEPKPSVHEFIAATQFEAVERVRVLAKYTMELHQQPPPLRIDWQLGKVSQATIEGSEAIVANGATVTAFGVYSSATNTLTSGAKAHGYLRLYAGSTPIVPPGVVAQFVTGLALVVIANAGMFLVLGKIASL
jgi:hypothetical protein